MRSVDVRVTQNKIAAMEVYIQEYIHRDTHMWNLSLKFYFASLIITLLPLLNIIELPISLKTHKIIFPIVGIILAFLFLYIAFHQTKRFNAVSKIYHQIACSLPDDIKRIQLEELNEKPLKNNFFETLKSKALNSKNSKLIFLLMFCSLILIAAIMICCYA